MPKELEKILEREAKKKELTGKRKDAYVYGGLRNTGWTPSTQRRGKPKKGRTRMFID